MLTSHAFKPRTFIRSRKAAINSIFISPLYRKRVSINYRVFYIAASYIFTTSFYYCFHLRSIYLIISIVDLHLYQQLLSSIAIIALYQYSVRSPPSKLVVSIFPFFYLLLIGKRLPSQYIQAYRPLKGPSLLTYLISYIHFGIQYIFSSTRQLYTIITFYIVVKLIYKSSSKTTTLRSSIARSIFLYAPIVLYKYQFYSLANGAKKLFTSTLLPSPRPQIQEPYSIISFTTTIYSRRVYLKEGPYIKVVVYNTTKNTTTPL